MQEQGQYLTAGLGSTVQRKLALGPLPQTPRLKLSQDHTPTLNHLPPRSLVSPPQYKTLELLLNRPLAFSRSSPCQKVGRDTDINKVRCLPIKARSVTGLCPFPETTVITSPLPWKLGMKKMSG